MTLIELNATLNSATNAIKFRWDLPYRLLVSLLILGCGVVAFGSASSPLSAIGDIGHYLGAPQAAEVTAAASQWLNARGSIVVDVARTLLFVGIALNVWDQKSVSMIPGPSRGAPTALLGLAALWEVKPQAIPSTIVLSALMIIAVTLFLFFTGKDWKLWLTATTLNFGASALYVLTVPLWLFARSPKNTMAKSEPDLLPKSSQRGETSVSARVKPVAVASLQPVPRSPRRGAEVASESEIPVNESSK
ncbi:hypothetical protein ACFFON_10135 [Arthrobacter citreus]|uniref:hypothetical protein n=1 Tax=Arthrobacter citreus TaxID=1670 RepID=UPI0031F83D55